MRNAKNSKRIKNKVGVAKSSWCFGGCRWLVIKSILRDEKWIDLQSSYSQQMNISKFCL
jgi:hypothetical protein